VRKQQASVVSRVDWRLLVLAAVSGMMVVVGFVAREARSAAGAASPSETCVLSWTVMRTPGVPQGELWSVAADAPGDAWAVGVLSSSGQAAKSSPGLIEHWDGSRWRLVASPAFPAGGAWLRGVSVTASDDAWAVGANARDLNTRSIAVAEHWDDRRWSRVRTSGLQALWGVAETSATDVWAVGADATGGAVVVRWDGSRWAVRLRLPEDDELRSVAALSPTDVWVGGSEPTSYLELHWDGKRWSRYTQPSVAPDYRSYPEVAAIGATGSSDIWAAGDVDVVGGDGSDNWGTVLLHWDGTRWRNVGAPQDRFVNSLAIRAPHDIAIAAEAVTWSTDGPPLLERRVGVKWQDTRFPSREYLNGLAPDQQQGLWGVGSTGSSFPHSKPLITRATCS
jgi:hypothetical protein